MKRPERSVVRTMSEAMNGFERQPVRQIRAVGIYDKKFENLCPSARKVTPTRVHPYVVCLDLRKGSLKSLGRYLQQEGGIPDAEVADELRKLISGNVSQAKYRVAVIPHPDAAANLGGRPQGKSDELAEQDALIVERFDEILRIEGKKYLARDKTAEHFDTSRSTVDRALRRAKALKKREKEQEEQRAEIVRRRDDAFANFASTKPSTGHVTKPAEVS